MAEIGRKVLCGGSELPPHIRIEDLVSVGQTPHLHMHALAQRLLALEGRPHGATVAAPAERVCVLDHLGVALGRFAGTDSFNLLVRRALALARADNPTLQQISINPNGSLEGLEQVANDAVVAIVAQFLGLLVTFIGEPLTLRLVRDAWPDATLDDDMKHTRSIA